MRILSEDSTRGIVKSHKKWVNGERGGVKADLIGVRLRYFNFKRADLRGADLERADLTRSNLISTNLLRTNLRGANLAGAHLIRADLEKADLTRANLPGAILRRANLTGTNLTGTNLTKANLDGANLERANLTGANLTGVDLTDSILNKANLTGANLTGVNFSGTKLNGAEYFNLKIRSPLLFFNTYEYTFLGFVGESVEGTLELFIKIGSEEHLVQDWKKLYKSRSFKSDVEFTKVFKRYFKWSTRTLKKLRQETG